MPIRIEPGLERAAPEALRAEVRRNAPLSAAPSRRCWPCRLLLLALLLPPLTVVALRWLPPPTTAFMLQSPTRPVQYDWVPAKQIAEVARRAVVASEDQKFWQHDGFDREAIEKARAHNKRSKRRRGASTISQQTAKNLFLWSGGGYFRKGIEAGFTVLIETLWSKPRILEVYLNIAEFGPGLYGVEAASQAYFGKSAAQLSAGEAARLAAVLPSPRRWSAKAPGPYVQKRARWILGQMGYGAPVAEPEAPEPLPGEVLEEPLDLPALPEAMAPADTPPEENAVEALPSEPVSGETPLPEAPAEAAPAEQVPGASVVPDETPPP